MLVFFKVNISLICQSIVFWRMFQNNPIPVSHGNIYQTFGWPTIKKLQIQSRKCYSQFCDLFSFYLKKYLNKSWCVIGSINKENKVNPKSHKILQINIIWNITQRMRNVWDSFLAKNKAFFDHELFSSFWLFDIKDKKEVNSFYVLSIWFPTFVLWCMSHDEDSVIGDLTDLESNRPL